MTLYSNRDSNIRKTWALFALFLAAVVGLGWLFSYIYNDQSILYFAIILSLALNMVAYWKSDSIAMGMADAHQISHEENPEIYHLVENLCIAAGIPVPKVYIIQDDSANAFATGRNPQHASIALTTGILRRLDRTELEGVIAHELSHVKNYDTLLSTVVVVLVGAIAMLSDIFMRSMWFRGGRRDGDREGGQNPIFLIIGIAAAILAPIAATLMQLAISRKREFLADASGALLTRYPEGLASALEKISSDVPLQAAKPATAHLFFVNPFKGDAGGHARTPFLVKLFMTHPPIEERVAALRGMEGPSA